MAMKRKFDVEDNESAPTNKQLKLIPFPNYEPDTDVAMSDAEPIPTSVYHTRLPSDASSASSPSNSEYDSPLYPSFDLYPNPFFDSNGGVNVNSHSLAHYASPPKNVGLLQPAGGFQHHGSNCTQIPKLRVACSPGVNGQRTMWASCDECGAISMVDSD